MAVETRKFWWGPLSKLFDKPRQEKFPAAKSLLFQVIESELATAEALLDLSDLKNCDLYIGKARENMPSLRGPEAILIYRRMEALLEKRALSPSEPVEFTDIQPTNIHPTSRGCANKQKSAGTY